MSTSKSKARAPRDVSAQGQGGSDVPRSQYLDPDAGMGIGLFVHAHQRLRHLYEISKLLIRFERIESALPDIMAVVTDTLSLRSGTLVSGELAELRLATWSAAGVTGDELRAAELHARGAFEYFAGTVAAPSVEVGEDGVQPSTRAFGAPGSSREPRGRFLVFPLLVEPTRLFGVLQLEVTVPMNETDVVFVSSIANQIAVSLDRQAVRDEKRQILEIRRRDAEEAQMRAERAEKTQRFLSELSEGLAASDDYRTTLESAVRLAAPFIADTCYLDELREDGASSRIRSVPPPSEGSVPEGGSDEAVSSAAAPQSTMVVPLEARGRKLGSLTFIGVPPRPPYGPTELALAKEIGYRTSMALDRALLHDATVRALADRHEILGFVSHDLRSPLNSIMLAADLLADSIPAGSQDEKTVATMKRAIRRMDRLIKDLLDVSSVEAGQLSVRLAEHTLAEIVQSSVQAVLPLALQRSIEIATSLAPDTPLVRCDPDRISQVLGNLLTNAIKFTPVSGRISVSATTDVEQRVVTVDVSDTGPGMTPAQIERVFDKRWQAKATASQGLGLGLYICRGIILAHGGAISVESTVGMGSSFRFTLRCGDPLPAPAPIRSDATAREGHARP